MVTRVKPTKEEDIMVPDDGAYDCEEAAAHTYDLAPLKYWGPETILNFPELEEMQKVSREEYLASLRRVSSGFSRGITIMDGGRRELGEFMATSTCTLAHSVSRLLYLS
ncbi:hypothetical protein ACFE04_025004 [Oxalis oulophora]